MSLPRLIVPGASYLVTRRTLRRHMLLRPDAAITQLILYALAVSAKRFGIQVHAFCAMSTHVHLVVTDACGLLPSFLAFFHRLVALATKVLRKWEGPVWDHEPTSAVRLLTREAVIEKIAYTLANPVAAGLVRHAQEWPGAKAGLTDLARPLCAKRPKIYFDWKNPQWPEEIMLPIMVPPILIKGEDPDDFRREVADELERQQEQARAQVRPQGRRFLGAERVKQVAPEDRATSVESLRKRNPTFAVGRGNTNMWRCGAAMMRAFRASYRVALDQWRAGVRSVAFPDGTWWMRVFHRAVIGANVTAAA